LPTRAQQSFGRCVTDHQVVVCVGTGGVGKTTTAAAVALQAARVGRSAIVVTIDPARRLGDALGITDLTNTATEISGAWPGRLHALMLDTKATFDALVSRYAADDAQRDRILMNPLYQSIAGALSGTQDYMAIEKLFELHESGDYDLVVVDTPPSQHALAFLESPALLSRLLNNRVYRLLTAPRGLIRAVNAAAQLAVRQVTKVVGGQIVDDAIAFFRAFEGMEVGFAERSAATIALLKGDSTAFALVTAPRRDSIDAALAFAEQLTSAGAPVAACICNRMTPDFGTVTGPERHSPHGRALSALHELARAERHLAAELSRALPGLPFLPVAQLESDVHDLDAIGRVADELFGTAKSPGRRGGR